MTQEEIKEPIRCTIEDIIEVTGEVIYMHPKHGESLIRAAALREKGYPIEIDTAFYLIPLDIGGKVLTLDEATEIFSQLKSD